MLAEHLAHLFPSLCRFESYLGSLFLGTFEDTRSYNHLLLIKLKASLKQKYRKNFYEILF